MPSSLFALVLLLLHGQPQVNSFAAPLKAHTGNDAVIRGVVTDIRDSRVLKVTLVFSSTVQTYRTDTSTDGTYSVVVQPGTYEVTVVPPNGFCRSKRAAFTAQVDANIELDFQVWVCPSDIYCCYQFAELAPVNDTGLKPLVLYGEMRDENHARVYTGAHFPLQPQYPVILTFNLLTVRCDRLLYDPGSHALTATGNVTWQSGKESGSGKQFEIQLNGSVPKVTKK
jgi:hypothetical protein